MTFRKAVLHSDFGALVFSTGEARGPMENWLIDLSGWYGGVGVTEGGPQRALGHGSFPERVRRTQRSMTLTGHIFVEDPRTRDQADRLVSGALWEGDFWRLEVTHGPQTLWCMVQLDGEVGHKYVGTHSLEVQIPLRAADPFLYGQQRELSVYPPGYGEGVRFEGGPFENNVFRFYGGPPSGGTLTNGGNADSWPRFTVRGSWPGGFRIVSGRNTVAFPHPVFEQSPVDVDMRAGSVMVRGVDQTHLLARRDWFPVKPGKAIFVRVEPYAPSEGWMDVHVSDTYI